METPVKKTTSGTKSARDETGQSDSGRIASRPGRDADQFPLRLPPGMRALIKAAADENGRSMNAEIIDVLRDQFWAEPTVDEVLGELEVTLALLESVKSVAHDEDAVASIIHRLIEVNSKIYSIAQKHRAPKVVILEKNLRSRVERILAEWEVSPSLIEAVVSGLVEMSLERIEQGEVPLTVWIEAGEHRERVELQKPEPARQSR